MAEFSLPLTPGVTVGGWEVIRELGGGGQGTVYLVRSAERVQEITKQRKDLFAAFRGLNSIGQSVEKQQDMLDDFLASTSSLMKPESLEALGALKIFRFEGQRGQAVKDRLVREVEVLKGCSDPAIVCLLDAKPEEGWMVTAYQRWHVGKPSTAL
jgi:serine/threonine protein kinase